MSTAFTKLKYCIYILVSLADNDFYVGLTDNLKRRLTQHFRGQSKATAPRRPFRF